MGISKTFLCLFLTFVIGSQAYIYDAVNDCMAGLYDDAYAQCRDYAKVITCLKNVTAQTDFDQERLDGQIKYFEQVNKEETCNNALGASCIQQEINMCLNTSHHRMQNYYSLICSNVKTILACLTKLNSTCSTPNVRYEIYGYNKTKKSCESGAFKQRMEEEKCFDGIADCVDEYHGLLNHNKLADACEKIESSRECLENLGDVCQPRHIESMTGTLNYTASQCSSGILTGKCSYRAIENCTAVIFGEMDDMFGKRSDSDSSSSFDDDWYHQIPSSCTKANIAAAKTCLTDLKPECKSNQQTSFYGNQMQEINYICEIHS